MGATDGAARPGRRGRRLAAAALGGLALLGIVPRAGVRAAGTGPGPGLPIRHVVEVMLENHTFDNLFADFPGADGVPAAATLPGPTKTGPAVVRPAYAADNEGDVLGLINNSRAGELRAMAAGPGGYRMDGYTRTPGDGLAAVTLIPPSDDPNLQNLAAHYALLDHNFQLAIAPTQPNVLYALAGSADGWMVNSDPPPGLRWTSVFDQLTRAHLSWRVYYGVPPSVLQGTVWDRIIPPGTSGELTTTSQFLADARRGKLPAFALVRPGVGYSEEPPEDVAEGDAWLGQLLAAVGRSPQWRSTAVFITYDEGGGFWDHLPPPRVTPFGYGTRTPTVVVSPYVRRGVFAPPTTNLSILAFVEHLWHLAPLDPLVARQNDLATLFDGSQPPLPPPRPPVVPPRTLLFLGASPLEDPPAVAPGRPLTLHLVATTPGLTMASRLAGPVHLELVPPPGIAPPAGVPTTVELAQGRALVTVRLAAPGYYRLLARGPEGARGWLTLDVGVTPLTAPTGPVP